MGARATIVGLGAVALMAATNPGCGCGDDQTFGGTGCGSDCNQVCGDGLPMGLIGSYTSVATAKDGTVWVSGYNDAPLDGTLTPGSLYGDLVVGKFDSGKKQVMWATVDGIPALPDGQKCADNNPKGWRHGISDAGPDVGLWTSMQLDPNDHPMVVYYDATNHQAKFAMSDGTNWAPPYSLMQKTQADFGRYAKMVIVNGNPVIAFLGMEKGANGYTRSRVIVGRANVPSPTSAASWTFEDAAVDEQTPCAPAFCDAGQVCVPTGALGAGKIGACVAPIAGCTPADCGAGKACVSVGGKATCVASISATDPVSFPNAFGDYVSLANGPDGLGLVVYDRVRGNLIGVTNAGGKWSAAILDGQIGANPDPMRKNTGDDGIACTLTIAPNKDWHIAYVNGIQEQLQYMLVPGGAFAQAFKPEVIDDGTDSGKPYKDGIHIIGDDASLQLDGSGNVIVVYQDSTAGALRYANGVANGGTHKWTAHTVAQQNGFAGFFPRFVPNQPTLTNFYRKTDHTNRTVSGDVAFVSP